METLSLSSIARAVGCSYSGNETISHISTDSRDIPPGCLFVALTGDRFDGHDFVAGALAQGAAMAVVSANVDAPAERLLRVQDTRQALLDIAGLYRRSLPVQVVGVTGSVGKTTTKEMVACVCGAEYKTLKTEMNLNNEIGLSQMIFQLNPSYGAAVLEMGMDGPGQIAPLSRAAGPNIGLVTNIGVSHLEAMGTRENICREKLDIRAGMDDGSTLILNGDDDMLHTAEDSRLNLVFYGIENKDCAVRGHRIKEFSTHTNFEISYGGNRFDAQIPSMGRHNVYNALAAFAVGMTLGIPPQKAIAALRKYQPAGMRQKIVVHNSFTVVEDCYNASPDSMRAALKTLGAIACDGKRIAVLADMLELSTVAEKSHLEAGRWAAESGADVLLCTGELAQLYVQGAKEKGMKHAVHLESKDDVLAQLKELVKPGDVIWVKGSRGMKLEELIEKIYKEL